MVAETGADLERRASWLELFFDLVLVFAVSQLASGLVHHESVSGFLTFLALFVPVWWAWVGFTWHATWFERDDDVHRILFLVAMMATAALAINIQGAFDGAITGFALSYAAVRLVLVLMYVREALRRSPLRDIAAIAAATFGLSMVLWLVSAFVPSPAAYVLWAVAMAIELATPLVAPRFLGRRVLVDSSHLPERFGLFVIIVLGESVIAVGTAVVGAHWHLTSGLAAVFGFAVAAAAWWIYFDTAHGALQRVLVFRGRSGPLARNVYSYGHFPIVVGLATAAAGVQLLILHSSAEGLEPAARWYSAGGVAIYLVALSLIHIALVPRRRELLIWLRFAAAAVLVALAAAGATLEPDAFAGLLAAILVALTAVSSARFRSLRARADPHGSGQVS